MRKFRLVMLALLVVLPFAAVTGKRPGWGWNRRWPGSGRSRHTAITAHRIVEWGYYSYYPYACAPYGYYGPNWFSGGVFIGVGPWYGWGVAAAGGWIAVGTAIAADTAIVADTDMAAHAATLGADMQAAESLVATPVAA